MIGWFIWGVSFIGLYVGIFWLHVISLREEKPKALQEFPKVSFIVPAYNEEKGLWKTVHSLITLDYPLDKKEIIIVDHGSSDKTSSIARQLIAQYPSEHIILAYKERHGGDMKAHAFNEGLRKANGEFVACVDADTIVMSDALGHMVPYFGDKDVGAVISTIKVYSPQTIYEKIQHLEYIFATFTRGLMSKIDTLHVTPGALSVYRKEIFDRYGGFDEHNITEDLEMAMRLRYHGYSIKLAKEAVNYTKAPATFTSLWKQRVRWFRGFIYNNMKYKGMLFKKKYGILGSFQYPLNIISVGTIILMFSLLAFTFGQRLYGIILKVFHLGPLYILDGHIPGVKEFFLGINLTIYFPIAISFCIALFIYHLAHKNLKERWRFPLALAAYLTVYPVMRSCHWMTAVYKELFRARKKW